MAEPLRPTRQLPRVRSVSVDGFQGHRSFRIKFDPHVNFLYGRNGCGKTTLINLINAALCGNAAALLQIRFNILQLELEYEQKRAHRFRFTRFYSKDEGQFGITIDMVSPRGATILSRTFRSRDLVVTPEPTSLWLMNREEPVDIWKVLIGDVPIHKPETTWLSINRGEPKQNTLYRAAPQSPIDAKLDDLVNRTTALLSSLDSRSAALSIDFQKEFVLSLIDYRHEKVVNKVFTNPRELDLAEEEATLTAICDHFKISPSEYGAKLKSHFGRLKQGIGDYNGGGMRTNLMLSLIDTYRLHDLNGKWLELEKTRKEIYKPKTQFLDLINLYFVDKEVSFDIRNRPVFDLNAGGNVSPEELSSGEKQVYIMLSEALIQEGRRVIYLADEPEISLHVEWQELLVDSIRKINSNCQILFATHSPDILGTFGDNAIDMEAL